MRFEVPKVVLSVQRWLLLGFFKASMLSVTFVIIQPIQGLPEWCAGSPGSGACSFHGSHTRSSFGLMFRSSMNFLHGLPIALEVMCEHFRPMEHLHDPRLGRCKGEHPWRQLIFCRLLVKEDPPRLVEVTMQLPQ